LSAPPPPHGPTTTARAVDVRRGLQGQAEGHHRRQGATTWRCVSPVSPSATTRTAATCSTAPTARRSIRAAAHRRAGATATSRSRTPFWDPRVVDGLGPVAELQGQEVHHPVRQARHRPEGGRQGRGGKSSWAGAKFLKARWKRRGLRGGPPTTAACITWSTRRASRKANKDFRHVSRGQKRAASRSRRW